MAWGLPGKNARGGVFHITGPFWGSGEKVSFGHPGGKTPCWGKGGFFGHFRGGKPPRFLISRGFWENNFRFPRGKLLCAPRPFSFSLVALCI